MWCSCRIGEVLVLLEDFEVFFLSLALAFPFPTLNLEEMGVIKLLKGLVAPLWPSLAAACGGDGRGDLVLFALDSAGLPG